MLFTSLEALRSHCSAVTATIVFRKDGTQQVVVTSTLDKTAGDTPAHLAQPFTLAGTAAELDQGFAGAFSQLATQHRTLAQQAQDQIDAKAKAAAEKKSAATVQKPAAAAGSAASELKQELAVAASAPAPVAVSADSLFGDDDAGE